MNEVVVNLDKLHTLLISVQFVKLNWMFEQGVVHKYLKYRFGVSLSNRGPRSVAAGHNEAYSISTIPRKRQKRTKIDTGKHFLCRTTLDILNEHSFRCRLRQWIRFPSKIRMLANLGVIITALETIHD